MSKPSIALIGAGSAGTAITLALHEKGYPVAAVASRSLESAQRSASLVDCTYPGIDPAEAAGRADVVIIATPDGVIEETCRAIAVAGGFSSGQLVIHLSGALGSDALESTLQSGVDTLSLHPAQTMAEPVAGASLLRDAWFCLEGNPSAVTRGRRLAGDISGKAIVISKEKKVLYHAALSVASNYLNTLVAAAVEMLELTGIPGEDALDLLMPLIRGGVDNLGTNGLPGALTGPISRGDAGTVSKHLHALQDGPDELLQLYRIMGMETLKLARAKGKMDPAGAQQIKEMLQN